MSEKSFVSIKTVCLLAKVAIFVLLASMACVLIRLRFGDYQTGSLLLQTVVVCLPAVAYLLIDYCRVNGTGCERPQLFSKYGIVYAICAAIYAVLWLWKGLSDSLQWARGAFILFGVSMPEEVLFRKYLPSALERIWEPFCSRIWRHAPVMLSGAVWGFCHSASAFICNNPDALLIGLSAVGSGVIVGFILSWLYKKSGSLALPILIHALFDY